MSAFLEIFLKLFFTRFLFPMALEIARKREIDPLFKEQSDAAYGAVKAATTTAERKAAARKLYELQKNS